MKKILLSLLLLPLFINAQLVSLVVRNDTLFGFNPSTGVYTQYTRLIPPQAGQAGKIVSTNGTNYEWIAQGGGSMIYPGAGVTVSTGSAWGTSLNIGTDLLAPSGNGSALTGLTKTQVGLSNVDNTSDASKPVSTAQQTALNLKQDFLANKNISWAQSGGGTTLTAMGVAVTATGTATTVGQATTNDFTLNPRLEYLVTVAATTAVAGWRSATATFNMGTSGTNGGLLYDTWFGNATGGATATTRCFVGIQASAAAPTDVEPSTLLNIFGIGWGAADANLQFMHNDGSGTATKVDLGASFPVPTSDRSVGYRLQMTTVSNSLVVNYILTNVITLATTSGTINTNLPANSVFLGGRGYISVGGTSSVIGVALHKQYIQAPYFNL